MPTKRLSMPPAPLISPLKVETFVVPVVPKRACVPLIDHIAGDSRALRRFDPRRIAAVVENDVAGGGAQIFVGKHLQAAVFNDRIAGVGVGAAEVIDASPLLEEAAAAGDRIRKGAAVRAVNAERRVRARHDHVARDAARGAAIADLQGALVDRGVAGVGARAGQRLGAAAGFY